MWNDLLKNLCPALPRHIDIQPRDFRGERWYILHDKSSGHYHRLTPSAHHLINLMNGRRTLADILSIAQGNNPDEEAPTQQDLVELLQYLHVSDLLVCDMPPNTQELFSRQQHKRRRAWQRLLLNPVTWKLPFGNPNTLLDHLLPLARFLASPFVALLWLATLGYALLQAGAHWSELTTGQLSSLLSPGNMLLLWLTYPLLKIAHELGHALFTKVWGGEVNECGLVIVMGTPLPYVDATAATGFRTKAQRLMVGAAGIAVELFFAALALLFWLTVEGGLIKDLLYNVIILGSVSTLFFNGNPLLKFDGYHLLCDLLETPNLGTRANRQVTYLVQRYAYGIRGLYSPAASRGEAVGFVAYALAAFTYRFFILALIVYLLATYSITLGVILGLWLAASQLLLPLCKYSLFLLSSQQLNQRRKRALGISAAAFCAAGLLFFYLPLPLSTQAEGVLWLPADSRIRAKTEGQVIKQLVTEGARVREDQIILQLRNPKLVTELQLKQAILQEYQARYQQAWASNRSQVNLLLEDMEAIQAEIAYLQEKVAHLQIRSPADGRITFSRPYKLEGSYLKQGDAVGFVVKREPPRIRVALTQREIGLVRQATQAVEVKLAEAPSTTLPGRVTQQVPQATYTLPSPVLGTSGGGRLALSSDQKGGTQTKKMVFLLDVTLPQQTGRLFYGERAYVLFHHPPEPLAHQIYRRIRQLFISTLQ